MNNEDRQKFGALMTSISAYYGKTIEPGVAEIYWQALKKYDFEDVKRAAGAHAVDPDSGQFMPKAADFVRHIDGNSASQASMAWAKVVTAIRDLGAYKSVAFDEPEIHAAIEDLGGWVKLCGVVERDLPFEQKRFENSYRGYKLRGILVHEFRPYLIGVAEGENRGAGYKPQPPVLIGDKQKALLITKNTEYKPRIAISAYEAVLALTKPEAL